MALGILPLIILDSPSNAEPSPHSGCPIPFFISPGDPSSQSHKLQLHIDKSHVCQCPISSSGLPFESQAQVPTVHASLNTLMWRKDRALKITCSLVTALRVSYPLSQLGSCFSLFCMCPAVIGAILKVATLHFCLSLVRSPRVPTPLPSPLPFQLANSTLSHNS